MQKQTASMMKSIGIGMLAGGITAAAGSVMRAPSRKYKKTINKAAKSMGSLVDSIADTFGM